jgi:LAS superfamily LD-carboxypeptidase LdcB
MRRLESRQKESLHLHFIKAWPSSVLVSAISAFRQWSEQRCDDPLITSAQPTM